MNTETIEGDFLDAAVMTALGLDVRVWGNVGVVADSSGRPVALLGNPAMSPFLRSPSREWAVGGPLIERYRVQLHYESPWWLGNFRGYVETGANPLVAAMRALVAWYLESESGLQDSDGLSSSELIALLFGGAAT